MEEFMLPRKDLLQIGLYTILICSLLSGSDGTLSIFVLQLAQHDTPMHQWNLPSLPKEFVWHPSSTINDCDLSAAFILGWHFYMGSDYLKSNLYLANNSMVTGHFNLKKNTNMFQCLSKSIIYIILEFTILCQNWYIKKDMSGSLKISNCD